MLQVTSIEAASTVAVLTQYKDSRGDDVLYMKPGFLPSAETKNIGLADASIGLEMISSGVDGRETRPV
jgi:hypothetical protein